MTNPLLLRLVFIAVGTLSIVAAIQDWDWFMNHRRALIFVKLFGRKGARGFYIALGTVLILIALFKL